MKTKRKVIRQKQDTTAQASAYQLVDLSEKQLALAIARLLYVIEQHESWQEADKDMSRVIADLRIHFKERDDTGEWPHAITRWSKEYNAYCTQDFLKAARPLTTGAKQQKLLFGRLPVDTK